MLLLCIGDECLTEKIRSLRCEAEVRESTDCFRAPTLYDELDEVEFCDAIRETRKDLEKADSDDNKPHRENEEYTGRVSHIRRDEPTKRPNENVYSLPITAHNRSNDRQQFGSSAQDERQVVVETVTTRESPPNIDSVRVRILQEDNAELQTALEALKKEKYQLEEQYFEVCAERDNANKERDLSDAQASSLQSDANAQKDLVSQLSKELEQIREQCQQRDREMKELKKHDEEVLDQLEKANQLNEEFQSELQRCRAENQTLRRDNVGLLKNREDTTSELTRVQTDLEELTARLSVAENEINTKKETIRELRGAKISLEQALERQMLKMGSLKNELELASVSHDSLKRKLKEKQEELKESRSETQTTKQRLSQAQDEMDKVLVERNSLQTSLTEADENGQRLQAQVETFRGKLEDMVKRVEAYKKQRSAYQQQQQKLVKLLGNLHKIVDVAEAHSNRCQARGVFALKSRRIHEDLQRLMDGLIDHVIESSSKLNSRQQVLQELKEMQLF